MVGLKMKITSKVESALLNIVDGEIAGFKKQLAIAVGKTAKKTESHMAKQVVKTINVAQKSVKNLLAIKKSPSTASATVELSKSRRLYLKDFRPTQTKKGVTYRISKMQKGRNRIPNAFIVPKFDGQVFVRDGKSRGPIKRKRGPSPYGVFTLNGYEKPTKQQALEELRKQVLDRVRFLKLKREGKIK